MASKNKKRKTESSEGFSQLYHIIYQKFLNMPEVKEFKGTYAGFARFLGVSNGKTQTWRENGKWPNAQDIEILHRKMGLSYEWLITGYGEPDVPFIDPITPEDDIEIGDTLHELLRLLPDSPAKVAAVGGLTLEEFDRCRYSKQVPPLAAIKRWLLHYKVSANFLLAQIGNPILSEQDFLDSFSGVISAMRSARGDFDDPELNAADLPESYLARRKVNDLYWLIGQLGEMEHDLDELREEKAALYAKLEESLAKLVAAQQEIIDLHREKARPAPPTAHIAPTAPAPGAPSAGMSDHSNN